MILAILLGTIGMITSVTLLTIGVLGAIRDGDKRYTARQVQNIDSEYAQLCAGENA